MFVIPILLLSFIFPASKGEYCLVGSMFVWLGLCCDVSGVLAWTN
ncbi:hypothetical protein IC582_007972 [Cucumis melo]